jgi:hypothetical protein
MTDKSICPFCKKEFVDILKHMVLIHDIKSLEHLKEEIIKAEKIDGKKYDFSVYIEELKEKIKLGEISLKEYRELLVEKREELKEGK